MSFEIRKRLRLPHWHSPGGTYFVTWNLHDALPKEVRQRIDIERMQLYESIERLRGKPTPAESQRIQRVFRARVEETLDENHGECVLRMNDAAKTVANALTHFDTDRYELLAWCVMPNHVHVAFVLGANAKLDAVLKSWKGYTARVINQCLGRAGTLWQEDYFDRLIRNSRQLSRTVSYIESNPITAGLRQWQWTRTYPERIGERIS